MTIKVIDIATALHSLTPNTIWSYEDDDYSTLVWESTEIPAPTLEQVEAEIIRLSNIAEAERLATVEAEAAKIAARESALSKLSALGLTEDEAKAVIGL